MLSAPMSVVFSITSKCNLACKHCLASDGSKDDLNLKEIKKAIEEIATLKIFSLAVFGGEPFASKDIFEILHEISKYPIGITINTNGTLIDERVAEKLRGYDIRGYTVSLDGSNPEIAKKMRGKGVFEKTIRGIKALLKYNNNVLISATVTKMNCTDLQNIAKLGKELNVNGVRFNNVFYINNAECFLDDLIISKKDFAENCKDIDEMKQKYGNFISGSCVQIFEFTDKIKKGEDKRIFQKCDNIEVAPCGAGTSKCAIKPNGDVVPCEILWNTVAGNIREKSLGEIWRSSKVMNDFRKPFTLTENEIGDCISCEFRYICYTGHRCNPYYYPGGLKNKKLFCIK